LLDLCEQGELGAILRSPLAMGVLTGKFTASSKLPENDVRGAWDFSQGAQAAQLEKLERVRDVLTSDGRTLAQGALGYVWALSGATVPIPGFKTVKQVEENAGAMEAGPLSAEQVQEIDRLLGR
jgi:aryl-alcohol dehydrogenase-like predicted oxidoreductase